MSDLTPPRAGQVDNGPHYGLATSAGHAEITHNKGTNKLNYASGPLTLSINTAPNELGLTFTSPSSQKLTGQSWRSIGYVSDQRSAKYNHLDGIYAEKEGYMLTELDLGVGEKIYGLGERFGPFVKNGQTVDIWNEDG